MKLAELHKVMRAAAQLEEVRDSMRKVAARDTGFFYCSIGGRQMVADATNAARAGVLHFLRKEEFKFETELRNLGVLGLRDDIPTQDEPIRPSADGA